MVEPAHRATLDTTSKHFVELGESLGKPVQLIAGAPCTYNKDVLLAKGLDGTHGRALWYRRRLPAAGCQARRPRLRAPDLVGVVYGLLGTTTHKHKLAPTPGYRVARPPQAADGTSVLRA